MCAGGGSLPLRSQAELVRYPLSGLKRRPQRLLGEKIDKDEFFPGCPKEKERVFLRWYFDCGENNAGRNVGIEKNNYQV